MKKLNIPYDNEFIKVKLEFEIDEIKQTLEQIDQELKDKDNKIEELNQKTIKIENDIYPIQHLNNLQINLSELYNLRYMRFRYGKISKEYYQKIQENIENLDAIVLQVGEEENYIWIIYLTTKEYSTKIDSYFNVMKFERVLLASELDGVPSQIKKQIELDIKRFNNEIEKEKLEFENLKIKYENLLLSLYRQLQTYVKVNSVKKYMAHDDNNYFYIIGWIPFSELKQILPKLNKEQDIEYMIKNHDEVASTPPTHLKNSKIVRSFETIVQMYGVPNYTELDPTWFVAITAFLMFGFMFGDVGHGLIIALIGFFLSKKKASLGPVFIAGGISSIIFGALYGSVFGKENIIKALVISPMENITTMLISGIVVGVILILISMILNIKNGIKNNDIKRIVFSENGIVGLFFYSMILVFVLYYLMKGKMLLPTFAIVVILLVPLLVIMFKDKILNIINKSKQKINNSFVEQLFEIIEILLSFASNTISFVRLAAFAINHVGLCMAVYILSNMASGAGNIAISIIGNIIVIVLEGLIVAIQVLRLEYYELFSRFYSGNGKEYKPIKSAIK